MEESIKSLINSRLHSLPWKSYSFQFSCDFIFESSHMKITINNAGKSSLSDESAEIPFDGSEIYKRLTEMYSNNHAMYCKFKGYINSLPVVWLDRPECVNEPGGVNED